jgi:alpha-mannosidase
VPTVHVVPHTHWDREWYRTAAESALRLAHLADDLVAALGRSRAIPAFLLDGQAVVLDDLADVRPAGARSLARLLRAGRLEAGPWYVLADTFLVSGEALVRNLLAGRARVAAHGGCAPAVGYVPDAFGHAGALPAILAGFGIPLAVAWRGFGGVPGQEGDLHRWRSADGSEVLLAHLPSAGYEYGASLPARPSAARARWRALRDLLAPRARTPHWLVLNGADHHALQRDLEGAVGALRRAAGREAGVRLSSLERWARAVAAWARTGRTRLPVVTGELRGGRRHAWALLGTTASRLPLKQANAACQRLLERVAEPLAVLARPLTDALAADLDAAWRELLRNHPHDSICGTSTDPVHREMAVRFDRVRAMTAETADRALDAAVGRDPDAAREASRTRWRPALFVFEPAARPRASLVEAAVPVFLGDVRVGQAWERRPAGAVPGGAPPFALADARGRRVAYQVLDEWTGTDRVESPRHYPDCDAVHWRRVVFAADALPPLGVAAFAVREGERSRPAVAGPVRAAAHGLDNGRLWLRVEADGTVALADRATGASAHGLGRLEDRADLGDSYTPSPRGRVTSAPDAVAVRVVHAGPLRGELEIVRRYGRAELATWTRVTLDAGAAHVTFRFGGENRRGDHRLRAAFPLGERARRVVADGPFGPVARRPSARRPRERGALEAAEPTAPCLRWVAVSGRRRALAVVTDGLPQYEASPDGTVRVTLLRAFGELSRADLPERPGHAGWPVPTPEAQCVGPFEGRIAVALVAPSDLDAADRLEALADAVLLPPVPFMRRATLHAPGAVAGPRLEGDGLVPSAAKPAADGRGVILRCWNARDEAVRGSWVVPWRVRRAAWCRLDETDVAALGVRGGRVAFEAGPRAVVTVRVRA